jgi:hypothetical protein
MSWWDESLGMHLVAEAKAYERCDDPVAGELWRVAWETFSELCVVVHSDADRSRIRAMPVLLDSSDLAQWCLLSTAKTLNDDSFDIAISIAHEISIPWFVLDAQVGICESFEKVQEARRAFVRSEEPPAELALGEPFRSDIDPRIADVEDVADAFYELVSLEWVPANLVEAAEDQVALDFDRLVEIGIPIPRALELCSDEARPTDAERRLIHDGLGLELNSVQLQVPDDLRAALDRPRRRAAVRQRAANTNQDERSERRAIAEEAMQPLAARGTQGNRPPWEVILDQILR